MKKPLLLAIVGGILLIGVFFFLFSNKKDTNTSPPEEPEKNVQIPKDILDIPDVGEEEKNDVVDEEEVAVPTKEDIRESVENPSEEAEVKFLTKKQKRELNSASIGGGEPRPRKKQTFSLSWADTNFSSQLPSLPESAPVYLLDRPVDEDIFDSVRDLAEDMGIKGAVLRSNRKKYSVADISKGEYYMTYDIYHLGFDAKVMNAPVKGSVKETLENWGVLRFPNVEQKTTDSQGKTWYRYQPKLELPVLTLKRGADDEFNPEKILGEVAAESNGKRITRVVARFPSILPKENVSLLSAEEMADVLKKGVFTMGDVILQYPGALPLEDKREFFTAARQEKVSVEDAQLSEVRCGYFLENDDVLQALLSPVCMASGKGKMDGKSVLFRVLFPAVQ